MDYTTTISQKGQIVVPKPIRDQLNLRPSDTLKISLDNNQIIVSPALKSDQALGMFSPKQPITSQVIKSTIQSARQKKFKS